MLFSKMENMDNSPRRLEIIKNMTRIVEEDSPWVWGFHPVAFGLRHSWVNNFKPNPMVNNEMKYIKIDYEKRAGLQYAWNRPVILPVIAVVMVLAIAALPVIISIRKRGR